MKQIIDPTEYFQFGVEAGRIYPLNGETKLEQRHIISPRFTVAKSEEVQVANLYEGKIPATTKFETETIDMRVRVWKGREIAVGYSALTNTLYVSPYYNQWSVE